MMLPSLRVFGRLLAIVLVGSLLAACKAELYSNMAERDANEIIGVLAEQGIESSRERAKDGSFTVSVQRDQSAQAIEILTRRGLPRQKFDNFGSIFDNKRIVSTPIEERARFMHALNQELANSISQIRGVVSARVHVMMPETSPLDRDKQAPRASILIYHHPDADLTPYVGVIKNLVTNAVAGLNYEDVAIGLFPANTPLLKANGAGTISALPTANLVTLGLLALLLFALFVMRRRVGEVFSLFSRRT